MSVLLSIYCSIVYLLWDYSCKHKIILYLNLVFRRDIISRLAKAREAHQNQPRRGEKS
jgi:hypothetical protein